jgi:D-glycero-D-manno-heptose 1,7-bisphosphate phosphatase
MGYINHIDRFVMLPDAAPAVKLLNDHDIPVAVVTNQSGLARGYFPEELLERVHDKMNAALQEVKAHIDGIFICPHHPEAKEAKYRVDCDCRKPKTGLFDQAAQALDLDLQKSYLVGDRWSDLKAAVKCGAVPVLVLTGYGAGDYQYIGPTQDVQPAYVAKNLKEAVTWIIADMSRKQK